MRAHNSEGAGTDSGRGRSPTPRGLRSVTDPLLHTQTPLALRVGRFERWFCCFQSLARRSYDSVWPLKFEFENVSPLKMRFGRAPVPEPLVIWAHNSYHAAGSNLAVST